jgi:beta-N-acetylhexosaminidase
MVKNADTVVFVSLNARESPYQEKLGLELPKLSRSLVAIAACNPYDFLDAPEIQTYLTTYEPTIEAFSVAAAIIFGNKASKGSLPVGPTVSAKSNATFGLYDAERDVEGMVDTWDAAFPTYHLPRESLRALFVRPNARHFVARIDSKVVGFCLAYFNADGPPKTVHVAVLAVSPAYQNQGIGTVLLTEVRSFFRSQFGLENLKLGSSFPRFWPGVPRDLGEDIQNFFTHRGWRLSPPESRSVDLYQAIKNFQAPEKYMTRARESGFTFAPLKSEDYDECLVGQRQNFSDKAV